jgi:hypothetical protein
MFGRDKERWMLLCEQAAVEQDHDKLIALVAEINALLDAKQARLEARQHPPEGK